MPKNQVCKYGSFPHFLPRTIFRATALVLTLLALLLPAFHSPIARADSPPTGLVLWNKLGSTSEVLNSEVGPDLEFFTLDTCSPIECPVSYVANPEFVPGVFGNAISIGPGDYNGGASRVHNVVLRNAQDYVNPERGTVEAWFRQTESGIPYRFGNYRVFDGAYGFTPGIVFGTNDVYDTDHFVFQYGIYFGGELVNATSLSNGEIGYDISAFNGQWIHLAGVWDRSGINGTADTLRFYVNGEIVANASENNWGSRVGSLVDIAGGNAGEIAGKFAVDNLKLWNIARTDFSDRFQQAPGMGIRIDVEPNNTKNQINLKSNGLVTVAILSTASFAAKTITVESVRFGPAAARAVQSNFKDVNRDGFADRVLKFRLPETGIARGDTKVCLSASTTTGLSVNGCDAIKTKP